MESKLLSTTSAASLRHPRSNVSKQTFSRLQFPPSRFLSNGILTNQPSSATALRCMPKRRVDKSQMYTLEGIRESLVWQEERIIFCLVDRTQFCYNAPTYYPHGFTKDGFRGSIVEYVVKETEKIQAKAGRYASPYERPFFPDILPKPLFAPLEYPQVLHPAADVININFQVWNMYFRNLLPGLVKEGDDGNYGSAALLDALCLQTLSKRIHYGKFVAEAKFQASPDVYKAAIIEKDGGQLMDLLTYETVEDTITKRVELRTRKHGQEEILCECTGEVSMEPVYKINPSIVGELYRQWIMSLTKQVQVEYLLRRLD
ncbi:chorismate mutase 1, chloroplastic-like [Salvia hispanica]|uniref:chorismate mutase 1, chloroplastic-like n=1 Tax=Salvia hispanica TaxID=49212 RepID=UPI0020090570|nr:chorismate mutase 1, chloroplastic-like [Salvia hispanica]